MTQKSTRSGPRGIDPSALVDAAVGLMEEVGAEAFSLRKLGRRAGCDPMAVLYHFKSKAALERAMADRLVAEIVPVDPVVPWRARLTDLARQYRALAQRYPATFPLLMRFWNTGPADYRHAEMTFQAFYDAGFRDRALVDVGYGWYATLLGLAAAEIGGLLRPASPALMDEMRALPAAEYPIMAALVPAFAAQAQGDAYALMVEALHDGIERLAARTAEPNA